MAQNIRNVHCYYSLAQPYEPIGKRIIFAFRLTLQVGIFVNA